ncbi:hypothetical protein [Caloramator proteoclasticus]|uniref:Uncharacterized protein n=1 Tax=Caloramator proteoclasticus DSM 10124 TaxID=1121262 RepID=A0A1M5BTU0_9CLOT|nr:hypothetical protein [Caloramator proteoclasticus]SHF45855.1 hypothetical protein SAMN02746091_02572 [Caloramator proteoclasticus DSM 10124]
MIKVAVESLDLVNRIENVLRGRKNLMFYDGKRDGLDENVAFKYFYSSPKNALDFINVDIFESPKDSLFGVINVIMDYDGGYEECSSDYGNITVEKLQIRGVDKIKVELLLNKCGITNIENAIEFFEGYIFNKTLI